jgi:TPR repeat protein
MRHLIAIMFCTICWMQMSAQIPIIGSYKGWMPPHINMSLEQVQKLSKQNNKEALYALGYKHEYGLDVAKNLGKAFEYYQKSAELGLGVAQFRLGSAYLTGEISVLQNFALAQKWLRKAAMQGFPPAQIMLALAIQAEMGAAKDPIEAYAWLNVASSSDGSDAEIAKEHRDTLAKSMTMVKKQKAQNRSTQLLKQIKRPERYEYN